MIYIEKELDDLKKEVLEMWDLVNSQLECVHSFFPVGYLVRQLFVHDEDKQ